MRGKLLKLIILFTVISAALPSFAAVSFAQSPDFVKVGISYGSSAPSSATVSSASGLFIGSSYGDSLSKSGSALDGVTSVTLKRDSGAINVLDPDGNVLAVLTGDGTECIASEGYFTSGEPVEYKGKAYRGGIMPYLNSQGQMNILNYISMEDYVKGVLNSEMGHNSDLEALKAQAVTARSFAAAHEANHESQGFNVCTTTHCQVYAGVSGEYDRTNQAVDETRGQMMYYNGQPVAGFYYANSGGHTENSEDVWSEALGYLRAKPDEFSPNLEWTVELSKKELNRVLSGKIGDVKSVTIDGVNASGYVASLTINGAKSSITVTKDPIRSVFGSAATLKSRRFTIDTRGGSITYGFSGDQRASEVPDTASILSAQEESARNYYASGNVASAVLGNSMYAVSASGTSQIDLSGMSIMASGGQTITATVPSNEPPAVDPPAVDPIPPNPPSNGVCTVYLNSSSDVLIISGKGYGHGVGMAQQGAQQMGSRGYSYIDILKYYYTGIEVR